MDAELKSWLLELITDVTRRGARCGDVAYDTIVAAYADLTNTEPNYKYCRRIIGRALGHCT